ncbi:MAG: hypothetical protein R3C97_02265 [Geminicoccaceae bacterium]
MSSSPVTPLHVATEAGRRLRVSVALDSALPPEWQVESCRRALDLDFVEGVAVCGGNPQSTALFAGFGLTPDAETDCDVLLDLICAAHPESSGNPAGRMRPRVGTLRLEREVKRTGLSDLLLPQQIFAVVATLEPSGESRGAGNSSVEEICRIVESYRLSIREENNRKAIDRASTLCLSRALRRLHAGRAMPDTSFANARPEARGQGLLHGLRLFCVSLRGNIEARTGGQAWRMAWRKADEDDLPGLDGRSDGANPFRRVVMPDDGEAADPFAVVYQGDVHLFFERIPPGGVRGELACGIFADGRLHDMREVMVRPFHLSYPQIFEADGGWWMIPESGEAGRVDLFRAERFPDRWIFEKTLLQGFSMVDATIHRQDGLWYLAVTVDECGHGAEWALFLFMSEQLTGPWRPHPHNPVRNDVRDTRGAGPFLRHGGQWLRPAQDGSRGYGSSLTFQRVLEMTPDNHAEERVASFRPERIGRIEGCHTFSQAGGFQFIDFREKR